MGFFQGFSLFIVVYSSRSYEYERIYDCDTSNGKQQIEAKSHWQYCVKYWKEKSLHALLVALESVQNSNYVKIAIYEAAWEPWSKLHG